jgi:hypothetical protein
LSAVRWERGLQPDAVKLAKQKGRKAFTTEPTESTEERDWSFSVLSVLSVGSVVKVV